MEEWKNAVFDYDTFFLGALTPSQNNTISTDCDKDVLSLDEELQYRYLGCHLIQRCGRLLKMPQSGIMTGQILLQQFYCQKSLRKYSLLETAMACTLIAGKVEECYRRVRDVINIFHHQYQAIRNLPKTPMDYICNEYYSWRDAVTEREMHILRELSFHVQPRHPLGLLANYMNALQLADDPRVTQRAVNYLNDGLRGVAYICWQPYVVACAAIEKAAEDFKVRLPRGWHLVFDTSGGQLVACRQAIMDVYKIAKGVDVGGIPLTREELRDGVNCVKDIVVPCVHPPRLTVLPRKDDHVDRHRPRSRSRSPSRSRRRSRSRSPYRRHYSTSHRSRSRSREYGRHRSHSRDYNHRQGEYNRRR